MKKILFVLALMMTMPLIAQEEEFVNNNRPEREEWLKDAGFGMFIHWNIDAQLGTVISHSLAGSSEAYAEKYIRELPSTFNPMDWNPEKIVILAKNAGMKYIVFTTKHHNGFCFRFQHHPYSLHGRSAGRICGNLQEVRNGGGLLFFHRGLCLQLSAGS